jgi:hypothetical protein
MKTKRVPQSNRLGAYLTATVGTSLLAAVQSDAAIQIIDIGPTGFNIAGPNGGVDPGTMNYKFNFPISGGGVMTLSNANGIGIGGTWGSGPGYNFGFATAGTPLTPTNFPKDAPIGLGATFRAHLVYSGFSYSGNDGPDFGSDSFMGFKTNQGNYGWLEVTWTGSTNQFQILAGAYEDQVGVAINAGDTGVSAVPEPASALSTMAMLASGLLIRRRKRVA